MQPLFSVQCVSLAQPLAGSADQGGQIVSQPSILCAQAAWQKLKEALQLQ